MEPHELERRRVKLGMSQRQLARELGVTQPAIHYWETGKRKIPGWLPKLLRFIEASQGRDAESE